MNSYTPEGRALIHKELPAGLLDKLNVLMRSPILTPVSYTHLDVYKRQAFNCGLAAPCAEMYATKRRWGKDQNRVQGYHIIQSFRPGEVTPEQAHAIGCEFVRRFLAERYETVIGTHLDKAHPHNLSLIHI